MAFSLFTEVKVLKEYAMDYSPFKNDPKNLLIPWNVFMNGCMWRQIISRTRVCGRGNKYGHCGDIKDCPIRYSVFSEVER